MCTNGMPCLCTNINGVSVTKGDVIRDVFSLLSMQVTHRIVLIQAIFECGSRVDLPTKGFAEVEAVGDGVGQGRFPQPWLAGHQQRTPQ